MKNSITLIAACAVLLVVVGVWFVVTKPRPHRALSTIKIGQAQYEVEVARSAAQQARGLSFRESLAQDRGMLFVFKEPSTQRFWMFGMKIPLDFVWIRDGAVVALSENIPPPRKSPPAIVSPDEPADQVLEINAGEIKRREIKIGDPVSYE